MEHMASGVGKLQSTSMDGNQKGICDAFFIDTRSTQAGPHKVKNMDVYLEPLIEELEILWEGVQVHDISRPPNRRDAVVRAILMWTMHDFQGYVECAGIYLLALTRCGYLLVFYISYRSVVILWNNRFKHFGL